MKEKKLQRILIMAGGTGGHVFPGLALARYFSGQGIDVHWLGTSAGLESRIIPAANIPLHLITIHGLRGKNIRTVLQAPVNISRAIWQARRIIKSIKPNMVIGMGGFVSGPGGVAAWTLGCPLIIHEQNAKAGLTNKLLSRIAKRVLEAFPDTFKRQNVVNTGNPLRHEIENLPEPSTRLKVKHDPFRLLILGGSLGAQALNDIVPKALAHIPETMRPEIWHQTGEKHFALAKNSYEKQGVNAKLVPFIEDMSAAYAWADLVLCRAGALTVSELCAVGLGAIFVPFPHAVDDHQTANAEFMVNKGAALCIQQRGLTESRLADIVREFSLSPEKRFRMAEAAYQLRHVAVSEKIFDICKEVCR